MEHGDEELNPRTCIVSKKRFDRQDLIRFVQGPDGAVVADLKENLPGRGVWVEARKSVVKQAVDKQLFARAFGAGSRADGGLGDLIARLLGERALQALALTKKAGFLVTGFAKVDAAIRSNKVELLLHASDASDDGKRKLASATAFVRHAGGETVETSECWTCDELSTALGLGNVNHAAALVSGASRSLLRAVRRFEKYQG